MTIESNVTVYVVDDDDAVRSALQRLLESAGYVVESFSSAATFLARKRHKGLGCIILDLYMPSFTGIDLQEKLMDMGEQLPIIFLTGYGSIPTSVKAMKRGAIDFLIKPVDDEVLLGAIQAAIARHRDTAEIREKSEIIRRRVASLTSREREVLRCVISGALNKQIAGHLGITEKTIKVHRGRVMEKMGVTSVADLVRDCTAAGIEPEKVVF